MFTVIQNVLHLIHKSHDLLAYCLCLLKCLKFQFIKSLVDLQGWEFLDQHIDGVVCVLI